MSDITKTIIRKAHNRENPYAQISKSLLRDKRLSNKSKGLMCYLLSLPDHWRCSIGELTKHSTDGISSIKASLQELESYGYIEKTQERLENGVFGPVGLIVHEEPIKKHKVKISDRGFQPLVEKPLADKPLAENQRLVNTDIINTDLNNNKNNNGYINTAREADPSESIIDFNEQNNKLRKYEFNKLKSRLSAIKNFGELHELYRTTALDDLLEELVYHVEHRDQNKCTLENAQNFAIKALREGTWGTPAGLVKKREEEHYSKKMKDQEMAKNLTEQVKIIERKPTKIEIKEFLMKCVDSGISENNAVRAVSIYGFDRSKELVNELKQKNVKQSDELFLLTLKNRMYGPKTMSSVLSVGAM